MKWFAEFFDDWTPEKKVGYRRSLFAALGTGLFTIMALRMGGGEANIEQLIWAFLGGALGAGTQRVVETNKDSSQGRADREYGAPTGGTAGDIIAGRLERDQLTRGD